MNERPDSPDGEGRHPGSEVGRPACPAALCGLELPPFEGPLTAFRPAGRRAPGEPVYLGGDLHAVHPGAADRLPGRRHDPSLERARITIGADDDEIIEDIAAAGVWCLALHGELADAVPCLTISDTEGRMRARLLLPPARLMMGIGHFWLPSVPPPPGSAEASDLRPSGI